MSVKRGEIYYADLSPVIGSEQGGIRPVLIVQNDVGNKFSPTVIAAAITSQVSKTKLPTHIGVFADNYGLAKDSVILLEQIRTIAAATPIENADITLVVVASVGHVPSTRIRTGFSIMKLLLISISL